MGFGKKTKEDHFSFCFLMIQMYTQKLGVRTKHTSYVLLVIDKEMHRQIVKQMVFHRQGEVNEKRAPLCKIIFRNLIEMLRFFY
jgi:hypothetical protein